MKNNFWKVNKDELVFDISIIFFYILFTIILNASGGKLIELVGVEGIITLIILVQFFVIFSLGALVVKFKKPDIQNITIFNGKYILWILSRITAPSILFILWFGGCMHFEDIIDDAEILFIIDAIVIIIAFIGGIISAKKSMTKVVAVISWIIFSVAIIAIGLTTSYFILEEINQEEVLEWIITIGSGVISIIILYFLITYFPKKIAGKIDTNPKLKNNFALFFAGSTAFSFMLLQVLRSEILFKASDAEYIMFNTPFLLAFVLFRVLMVSAPPTKILSAIIAVIIILLDIIIIM